MNRETNRIEALHLPGTLAAADAADFLDFNDLCDALAMEIWGSRDRSTTPQARLRYWQASDYLRTEAFFLRVDGRMVGRASVRFGLRENRDRADLQVGVLTEYTGRGIGRALLRHAEAVAAAGQRSVFVAATQHAAGFDPEGPDLVRPATGAGALPAGARGVRFATAAGYRLEQVERYSSLDVAGAAANLDGLEREARAKSDGYDLVTWTDGCRRNWSPNWPP